MRGMRRLESGMSVNNELFSDIVRYEHETISETTIINSNIGSPIFWSCNLQHLIFDTCDLTNARFLPVVRLIIVHLFVPTCARLALPKTKLFSPIANFPPAI